MGLGVAAPAGAAAQLRGGPGPALRRASPWGDGDSPAVGTGTGHPDCQSPPSCPSPACALQLALGLRRREGESADSRERRAWAEEFPWQDAERELW